MAAADEDDLFADLYDGDGDQPQEPVATSAVAASAPVTSQPAPPEPVTIQAEPPSTSSNTGAVAPPPPPPQQQQQHEYDEDDSRPFDPSSEEQRETVSYENKRDRPVQLKDDGKMFIGGLNWETTDQSLKDYFSQFGEVTECTVMRDGATGRSRGFGFLTFRDPKTVNIVMVKEHVLDGKLIDPKRAIPRDEQEKTSKIFVGGVSQDANEHDFKSFFEQFGRVLDATLMMDKDTGRPRGFGFVTFDSDSAVDRTLDGPLEILGKPIEVKRAQPRNNVRDEDDGSGGNGGGRGGRFGGRGGRGGGHSGMQNNSFGGGNMNAQQGAAGPSMSQAQMAQMWMNMQNLWKMTQQNAMQNNPAMMQQMMAMQAQNNPAMMQQMAAMYGGGMQQQSAGSPMNGGMGRGNFNGSQDQMGFEQSKYESQQMARMQQQNFAQENSWEGMYDDVPAPGGGRGGRGGRGGARGGGGGGGGGSGDFSPNAQAPVNAPTGPKNAGRPGSNYRGGGRGGHRGYHPYARGGG